MKKIIKGLIKKKSRNFIITKKEEFLINLKLLGKENFPKYEDNEIEKKDEKIEKTKIQKNPIDVSDLFSEYLEEIDTTKMDSQQLLLSPLLSSRKEKIENFKKNILNENKKKISLLNKKKEKYSISLIDKSLVNMEWFLKNEKEKLENLRKTEKYLNMSEKDQILYEEIFQDLTYHPDDVENDKIAFLKYEGTRLGPRMEDDPASFFEYWKNSISDTRFFFQKKMEMLFEKKNEIKKNPKTVQTHDLFLIDEWAEEFDKHQKNEIEEIDNFYNLEKGKKKYVTDMERNLNFDIEHNPNAKKESDLFDHNLPILPHTFKSDNTDHQAYISYWGIMTTIINWQKQEKNKEKIVDHIFEKVDEFDKQYELEEKQKMEKFEKKPNLKILEKNKYSGIPSIMPYYDLLPEFVRKNQAMKTLCVTLEKHNPKMPLEEKQRIVNNFSQYCLPLKKADEIYAETIIRGRRKYYMTREDEIQIDDPTDRDMSINSKKKILLDNIKSIDGTAMPELNTDIYNKVDKNETNPIDFYDNDDGFWDEFIDKKKEKLNDYPIYDSPAFFK